MFVLPYCRAQDSARLNCFLLPAQIKHKNIYFCINRCIKISFNIIYKYKKIIPNRRQPIV